MQELLKRYFGHDEFRPMQKDIIDSVMAKKDTFVLMPTGGGKSVCYQIPALQLNGLTLVVSPLISLMEDQVQDLKSKGIPAEYINSSISRQEALNIQLKIMRGEIKLLYVAPERLALNSFRELIMTTEVSLIAIDEAHCISEWGHDFRPDYRNLHKLKEMFPNAPTMALTATAPKEVREDIIKQLGLKNPEVYVSSFDRKNLNLIVRRKKDTFSKIVEILSERKNDSTIIYCFSRKEAEKIANDLRERGFKALPYHAGLENEKKRQYQDDFVKDNSQIVVATIAFGMGIDKPDIRLVIHHTFPKTMENYYQEIGRAGRDGQKSDCIMFYTPGDKKKQEYFIDSIEDKDLQKIARDKMKRVMDYAESKECRRKSLLRYFGEITEENNCQACDFCLGIKDSEAEKPLQSKTSKPKGETLDYDEKLFEKLKILRKQIADAKKVPPYVIFGDFALKQMASSLPTTRDEFLQINGVAEYKADKFGKLFLESINEFLEGE